MLAVVVPGATVILHRISLVLGDVVALLKEIAAYFGA